MNRNFENGFKVFSETNIEMSKLGYYMRPLPVVNRLLLVTRHNMESVPAGQ